MPSLNKQRVQYFYTVVNNFTLIKFNYKPNIKMKFQFRNYIRAVDNAFVIGHVTPFLYKQPCFECTEVFFY